MTVAMLCIVRRVLSTDVRPEASDSIHRCLREYRWAGEGVAVDSRHVEIGGSLKEEN